MTTILRRLMQAGLLCGAMLASALPASALDATEKEELGAFIREYLIENPEVLVEAQQALEARQQAAQQAQAGEAITAHAEAIFNAPADIAVGNPEGDVTIVEFFDYNCGYCKRAHADMQAVVAADEDVRFVLKEFPILGPDSLEAHRVSMAFRKLAPERYAEFQDALITSDHADGDVARALALELGAEAAALDAAMQDPEIEGEIRQAYQLADVLGISGTPSYVVGDEAVFGAMGADVLMEKIANMRRCDSATC
ncbi:DsbA family protein [Pararhizobium haloflavum]|uniref:DsbA family protein n=1 Tax=Pararhizobium haloflavum TaxID=2037914 RepID=UPI000C197C6B|nr:DsbA family protein [Pararhizobium haloflavum]